MAINSVITFTQESGINDNLEAETANFLMREVHKNLVSNGMQPWQAIPTRITYEGVISDWVTNTKIARATEITQKTIKAPLSEVADFLLRENNIDTWTDIAFKAEAKEISEKFKFKKQALEILLYPDDEEVQSPILPECQIQLDNYKDQINSGKNPIQLSQECHLEERTQITQMVRHLTLDAICKAADNEVKTKPEKRSFVNICNKERQFRQQRYNLRSSFNL